MPSSTLAVVLSLLAVAACGGADAPAPGPTPTPGVPLLVPSAVVGLSGVSASGVAEAEGRLWVTHYDAGLLSEVDPATETELATVPVGPRGASVTGDGRDLWIARYDVRPEEARLTRVDVVRRRVVQETTPAGLCCEVAVAAGRVWALDRRGLLLGIDPDDGRTTSRTAVVVDPAVHGGLVGDARALWVGSDTTALTRVDPTNAAVVATLDVGGGIPMTLAEGLVWGAGPHHVWAVDPASNTVSVRVPLEDTIEVLNLAVTGPALFVGARRPGYRGVVLRIDRATRRLVGETDVSLPARLLFARGRVWVVDWDTNRLLAFDP